MDLTGPLAADAGFEPMKNAMIGRLIMMNRMCFMLLCFMSSACRFLNDYLAACFFLLSYEHQDYLSLL
jgi:hypothetical protein